MLFGSLLRQLHLLKQLINCFHFILTWQFLGRYRYRNTRYYLRSWRGLLCDEERVDAWKQDQFQSGVYSTRVHGAQDTTDWRWRGKSTKLGSSVPSVPNRHIATWKIRPTRNLTPLSASYLLAPTTTILHYPTCTEVYHNTPNSTAARNTQLSEESKVVWWIWSTLSSYLLTLPHHPTLHYIIKLHTVPLHYTHTRQNVSNPCWMGSPKNSFEINVVPHFKGCHVKHNTVHVVQLQYRLMHCEFIRTQKLY